MYTSRISGLGYFVPDNIVTNDDLSKLMDTNDEWIQERTGIKERRWIEKGSPETSASMGAKAAKIAIEKAGIDKRFIKQMEKFYDDLVIGGMYSSRAAEDAGILKIDGKTKYKNANW